MVKAPLHPLLFQPHLRPMPWGGRRLARWVKAEFPREEKIGEAWLISDHAQHASVVANGPLAGTTLRQLMAERGEELVGFAADRFPLLVKLLDAKDNLSIQVHPDDELAKRHAPTEGGKSEAWLVLETAPEAAIYLGLKPGFDRAALERELATGNLPLCLNKFEAKPGDCYNLPAGAVHALGAGCLVFEVQQTSDATFRLHDWGRVGPDGQPRPLHLKEGLACVKENPPGAGKIAASVDDSAGSATVVTPHFTMRRVRGSGAVRESGPFLAFPLKGTLRVESLSDPKENSVEVGVGQCVLKPAALKRHALLLPAPTDQAIVVTFGRTNGTAAAS